MKERAEMGTSCNFLEDIQKVNSYAMGPCDLIYDTNKSLYIYIWKNYPFILWTENIYKNNTKNIYFTKNEKQKQKNYIEGMLITNRGKPLFFFKKNIKLMLPLIYFFPPTKTQFLLSLSSFSPLSF